MLAERLAEDAARFAGGWNFGPPGADAKPVSGSQTNWLSLGGMAHRGNAMRQCIPGSPLPQVRRVESEHLFGLAPTPSLTSGPRLDRGMVPRLSARGQS